MGWSEATFTNKSGKRQQVWVKTSDDGAMVVSGGLVDMRYSDDDSAKIYRGSAKNIDFGGSQKVTSAPRNAPKKKNNSGSARLDENVWKDPAGERVVRHEVPRGLEHVAPPPAGVIDAWTDGACTGNPGPAGYGVVLRFDDQHIEISQYIGIGTNNIAELLAIRVALEELRDVEGRVRIHTDSSYSIGVLDKNWKAKKNTELVASIRELMEQFDPPPHFIKVRGHAGVPLNERADQLAVQAVEKKS